MPTPSAPPSPPKFTPLFPPLQVLRQRRRLFLLFCSAVCLCLFMLLYQYGDRIDAELLYTSGSDGTYAQNHQDTWMKDLADFWGWHGEKNLFVDLGAFHGERCSNTALLERELGWRGVCLEPFPVGFEKRKCTLVKRALYNRSGVTIFFRGEEQTRAIADDLLSDDAASSTGADVMTTTNDRKPPLLSAITITPSALVNMHLKQQLTAEKGTTEIRFVSLDVEGREILVLSQWPWALSKPSVWIIEHRYVNETQRVITSILEAKDYVQVPVTNAGVDAYYVLRSFDPRVASSRGVKSQKTGSVLDVVNGVEPWFIRKPWRVHPIGSGGC